VTTPSSPLWNTNTVSVHGAPTHTNTCHRYSCSPVFGWDVSQLLQLPLLVDPPGLPPLVISAVHHMKNLPKVKVQSLRQDAAVPLLIVVEQSSENRSHDHMSDSESEQDLTSLTRVCLGWSASGVAAQVTWCRRCGWLSDCRTSCSSSAPSGRGSLLQTGCTLHTQPGCYLKTLWHPSTLRASFVLLDPLPLIRSRVGSSEISSYTYTDPNIEQSDQL